MASSMAWLLVLGTALSLLCAASASAGTIGLDQQCGGMGGDCASLKECVDAPWTKQTCSGKLGCQRINYWWWQCKEGPASTPGVQSGPIQLDQQCGGMGGECASYGAKAGQCKDAAFTVRKCATGLTCMRINEWHWQCMSGSTKPEPSPRPPVTGGAIGLDQQCGGMGGDCASLKECVDAPWTKRKCADKLGCQRINVWWWQCKEGSTTPVVHTGPIQIDQQCGGMGGECLTYGAKAGQCKDAAFTVRKCATGLHCMRINEWHWQCAK